MVGRPVEQRHVDKCLFAACRRSVAAAGERDAAPVEVRAAREDVAGTVVRLDAGDGLPIALDSAEAEPVQELGGRRVRKLERLVLHAPARRRVVRLERIDGVEPQLGGTAGVAADGVGPRDLCPVGRVVGAKADRVAVGLGAEHVERAGQAQHRHAYILPPSLGPLPTKKPPDAGRLLESPPPDSNRRPLTYHSGLFRYLRELPVRA